jgi:cob(I)alamin adenosyltransferase
MGNRLSKITTRTGDDGTTSVGPKERLRKDHARIETLGTLDELNSAIGIVLAYIPAKSVISDALFQVQQDLFDLGGELCPPYKIAITEEKIAFLDGLISSWNDTLPPLKEFILPGGNLPAAHCHLARTICRRAERRTLTLHAAYALNAQILQYLNRLSDVLFIAARMLARETSTHEPLWQHIR